METKPLPGCGSLVIRDIRLPLVWTTHCKGDNYACFCLLRVGDDLRQSELACDIDSQQPDVSFPAPVRFQNVMPGDSLFVEFYIHKVCGAQVSRGAEIGQRLRRSFRRLRGSVSRALVKSRAAAVAKMEEDKDSRDWLASSEGGLPKFVNLGRGEIPVEYVQPPTSRSAVFQMTEGDETLTQSLSLRTFGHFTASCQATSHSHAVNYLSGTVRLRKSRQYHAATTGLSRLTSPYCDEPEDVWVTLSGGTLLAYADGPADPAMDLPDLEVDMTENIVEINGSSLRLLDKESSDALLIEFESANRCHLWAAAINQIISDKRVWYQEDPRYRRRVTERQQRSRSLSTASSVPSDGRPRRDRRHVSPGRSLSRAAGRERAFSCHAESSNKNNTPISTGEEFDSGHSSISPSRQSERSPPDLIVTSRSMETISAQRNNRHGPDEAFLLRREFAAALHQERPAGTRPLLTAV